MKFKVGDKVRTEFGNGEIVFIAKGDIAPFLVKIKGFDGYDGSSRGYDNEDGLLDKWWFIESQLELLEKEEVSVDEKMKRDLIKALFARDFDRMFIDFIEKVNKEYGIKGHEVVDIFIKEYGVEEEA